MKRSPMPPRKAPMKRAGLKGKKRRPRPTVCKTRGCNEKPRSQGRCPEHGCDIRGCKGRSEVAGMCLSHAEAEADRRFSWFIRNRDGKCMAQGWFGLECKGPLAAAHGWGRGYHLTRFHESNVFALCNNAHHVYVDNHEAQKDALFAELAGSPEVRQELRDLAISGSSRDRLAATAAAMDTYAPRPEVFA